ncbi:MAG: tRNA (adenosine(37)-N6)-threonylcarbamoyltransferase complex transferase subunit TsaD [Candidatus Levybacteria bacterium]|nr:tRNA (adenosine(37)-N6)-threonylcarbamoyltransferase complex transferase subunit TsaD [Candidatus Levybacteria bacterium]
MNILAIESSCDETGAAVLTQHGDQITILSNIISTSLELHAKTGGIIPEVAAREQVKFIIPVIQEALGKAFSYTLSSTPPPIDAIAVTYGPGLIGSLLVGVETAKTLSLLWNIPIIPVNHMYGHIYANFIHGKGIELPAIALVVSGGHTDLIFLKSHTEIEHIGQTRDDAAGEAFDKIGRLLGLPYPAGPTISKLAINGDHTSFNLPRPMIGSHDFDFSFSGLKTSVLNVLKTQKLDFANEDFAINNQQVLSDLCASVQYAIVNVLTRKTLKAVEKYRPKTLLVGGGVAANTALKESLTSAIKNDWPEIVIHIPDRSLCTDNAAMIAAHAFFLTPQKDINTITAAPGLSYI